MICGRAQNVAGKSVGGVAADAVLAPRRAPAMTALAQIPRLSPRTSLISSVCGSFLRL
jgi:hypothetical protein